MSLETWKAEYYPVAADAFEEHATDVELVQHALRKWQGLLPDNLERHGLELTHSHLHEKGSPLSGRRSMGIHSWSCALCVRYNDDSDNDECPGCPIYESRGVRCDHTAPAEQAANNVSPYEAMDRRAEVQPMIAALQKAMTWALEQAPDQEPKLEPKQEPKQEPKLEPLDTAMAPLPDCVLRLLAHSWKDIGLIYDRLTGQERAQITREEFAQVRRQIVQAGLLTLADLRH